MKKISRRNFLKCAVSTGIVAGLTACDSQSSSTATSSSITTSPEPTTAPIADAIFSFPTDYNIYYVEPAIIQEQSAIAAGSYEGMVLAYTPDGTKLWESPTNGAFINEFIVADINLDGKDEILAASADGTLYVFDNDGKLLWTFTNPTPLFCVCVAKDSSGTPFVFVASGDKKLYKLEAKNGSVVQEQETVQYAGVNDVIVRIYANDIDSSGHDAIIMGGTISDNFTQRIYRLNPDDISTALWTFALGDVKEEKLGTKLLGRWEFADVTGDGKKEILLSDARLVKGAILILDANGTFLKRSTKPDGMYTRVYSMLFLSEVKTSTQDYILGNHEQQLIVYEKSDNIDDALECTHVYTAKHAYANGQFDPNTNCYYMASDISGGNCIHVIDLENPNWTDAYETMEPVGRMAEITENYQTIKMQIEAFEMPSYQTEIKNKLSVALETPYNYKISEEEQISLNPSYIVANSDAYENVTFSNSEFWTEDYNRSDYFSQEKFQSYGDAATYWIEHLDTRKAYDLSYDTIIERAIIHEQNNEPFNLWIGHGTDPCFMRLDTILKIIEVAPTTCDMLIYSELGGSAPEDIFAIQEQMLPIANAVKASNEKHGTRMIIMLRNKGKFWNDEYQHEAWKDVFSGEYRSVIIPSTEETNSRSQELSLAGRVGISIAGIANNWGGRLIEDNAVHSRHFQWACQKTQVNFLRNALYQISYGASHFQNGGGGNENYVEPIYKMVEKGALIVPDLTDVLSISDTAILIQNATEAFSSAGDGHDLSLYEAGKAPFVFNNLDKHMSGYPVAAYDLSHLAYGVEYRTFNFMPPTPYGLVVNLPGDYANTDNTFKHLIKTNGEIYLMEDDTCVNAQDYQAQVVAMLEDSKTRLPFYIEGDAAWSATRIDDTHTRIYVIDPEYVNPSARDISIIGGTYDILTATDILSGNSLDVSNNRYVDNVEIPAGVFRVIDIEHSPMSLA